MADHERLAELAKIGAGLVELQLALCSTEPKDALQDIWALGYCFGIFDAIIQKSNLDQYTEGTGILTFGFGYVLNDLTEGAKKFNYALDRQENPIFQAGCKAGGTDIFEWFANSKVTPMSLIEHFSPSK